MPEKLGTQSVFEKFTGMFIGVMVGARGFGGMGRLAAGDIGNPVFQGEGWPKASKKRGLGPIIIGLFGPHSKS